MIPIIIGPTGLGYTDIQIINQLYIEHTTRNQSLNIGELKCITGYTGIIGPMGTQSTITGPTGSYIITGPTGLNMDAILFNPNNCKLRILLNNNQITDFGPFDCHQIPKMETGPTGPMGPSVNYIIQYSNSRIQTVYSNNYVTYSNIACLCESQTGYTGPTGYISEYGATGATGLNGINTPYGTTGSTGPMTSVPTITSVEINKIDSTQTIDINNGGYISPELPIIPGDPGGYAFSNIADGVLDPNGLQFDQTGNMAFKRNYVAYKNWSQLIFPASPLNFNMSYNSYDLTKFEGLGDGLLCKSKMIVRIRLSWDCEGTPYIRPFVGINVTNAISLNMFPIIVTTSFPSMTIQDDMYCLIQDGDIISVVAGSYSMYPISPTKVYKYNFKSLQLSIVQLFNY